MRVRKFVPGLLLSIFSHTSLAPLSQIWQRFAVRALHKRATAGAPRRSAAASPPTPPALPPPHPQQQITRLQTVLEGGRFVLMALVSVPFAAWVSTYCYSYVSRVEISAETLKAGSASLQRLQQQNCKSYGRTEAIDEMKSRLAGRPVTTPRQPLRCSSTREH